MKQFFPQWQGALRRWLLVLGVAAGAGLGPGTVLASHIRAGDIQARLDTTGVNLRRVHFKMTLYTDNSSMVKEERVTIFFGDGTSSGALGIRRDGPERPIPGNTDTSVNIYTFEHTYNSSGQFTVHYIGENRNAGVLNMTDSQNQSFYISTTFTIQPSIGFNRSPVLSAPAIDRAGTSQVFLHNPAASDANGDSLFFRIIDCQQVLGGFQSVLSPTGNNVPQPVRCTNYRLPNDPAVTLPAPPVQVPFNGVPAGVPGAPAIFVIDPNTGQLTWNAPVRAGFYNIAFEVQEWRRSAGGVLRIGTVIRDMQIIVRATNNLRPSITIPADICVEAGQTVVGSVSAVDGAANGGQNPTAVTLFAYGGMLPPSPTIRPPGTFTQGPTGPSSAQGTFRWTTDCSNVAQLPYTVVFKAQDSPPPPEAPLIDERAWRITVVGPAPRNLVAVAQPGASGNQTLLTWDRYVCQNASRIYVYRKEGCSTFVPGPCDTGIPASSGYTRIGAVAPGTSTFVDTNAGAGLGRGRTYSYRIYAEFPLPAGGNSIASQEACVTFVGRTALLKNVDVQATSATAGEIAVRWTRPVAAAPFGQPAGYRLLRATGQSLTGPFALVQTFTSLNDTVYIDRGLNTAANAYTYKLEFFSQVAGTGGSSEFVETSTASSVRTTTVANGLDKSVALTWTYNVPWDNTARPATIFRRTGSTGAFTQLAQVPTAATGGSYVDRDPALLKNQEYCYYVLTEGRYNPTGFLSSLLNRSQVQCTTILDQPCTPQLTLLPTNCDSLAALQVSASQQYTNHLRWQLTNAPTGCTAVASYYRIFYRAGNSGPFALIDSTSQTTYTHRGLPISGGCYQVQAVDARGVRSGLSNEACQDNCVFFVLPNIFTPNGDGRNDTFRPKVSSPLRRVRFQAFNRWGVKVFENVTTSDVFINWDGGGPVGESGSSGAKVADGVYFYLAEVEFADNASTKRTYKGWVEVAR